MNFKGLINAPIPDTSQDYYIKAVPGSEGKSLILHIVDGKGADISCGQVASFLTNSHGKLCLRIHSNVNEEYVQTSRREGAITVSES